MRYKPSQKEESRARILEAAGKMFRRHGLGGIGVDGLAKAAGLTSGAFYVHFKGKAQAFHEVALEGLTELLDGVRAVQAEHGEQWLPVFVDFYLGFKRTCELDSACGLQALTPEVSRADVEFKIRYEAVMLQIVEAVAQGLPEREGAPSRQDRAWSLLALLSGGVTMARSLGQQQASDEIASSLRTIALAIAG